MKHTTGNPSWEVSCAALDACVNEFADDMKRKLYKKASEGYTGWDDHEWPMESVIQLLCDHVEKGDMVDVANFAMFAWNKADGKLVAVKTECSCMADVTADLLEACKEALAVLFNGVKKDLVAKLQKAIAKAESGSVETLKQATEQEVKQDGSLFCQRNKTN